MEPINFSHFFLSALGGVLLTGAVMGIVIATLYLIFTSLLRKLVREEIKRANQETN